MDIISPGSWMTTQNGQILYAYGGTKSTAGVQDIMINIPNIGLNDLMVNVSYTADWASIQQSLGISISIDGTDIIFMQNDTTGGMDIQAPWLFTFPVPAQTTLAITSHCDAASTGAFRGVYCWASRLLVQ